MANKKIEISIEKIDAKRAAQYLSLNVANNRNKRPGMVAKYAADMVSDNWKLTGESIKFDVNDRLFDGQNRLSAIIEADKVRPGIAIEMVVARGIDPTAMIVVDSGGARSPGDAVRIAGIDRYETAKAALAKRIILFESGKRSVFAVNGNVGVDSRATVIKTQIVQHVIRFNDELETCCAAGLSFYDTSVLNFMTPTDWAFAYWILSKADPIGAKYFLGRLSTLEDVPKDSPIRQLFNKMQSLKPSEKLDEIWAAFDAYCRGKSKYMKPQKPITFNLFTQK